MRNKGAIKLVAIVMALVSIYQLSFTFVTSRVEKKANEYAQGDPFKKSYYKDSLAGKPVYNFLGLKKYTYRDCQEREFNLGLDLKGGMNVTLEVNVIDVVRGLSNYSTDPTFVAAINLARQNQTDSQDDFVTLFGQAFETVDPDAKLASVFNTIELKDEIQYTSTNQEVLNVIRKETQVAIDNSVQILRNRIDQFGVAQPSFQELGASGRVMIELPGIKDPKRVRKLLQGAAKLEFWETYENADVYPWLDDANRKIKEILDIEAGLVPEEVDSTALEQESVETQDPAAEGADDLIAEIADTTGEESLIDQLESDTTAQAEDQTYEEYAANNPLFAVLNPHGSAEGLYKGPVIGRSLGYDTVKVNRYLNMEQIKSIFPSNIRFYWTAKPMDGTEDVFALLAIKVSNREGKAALDGSVVTKARAEFGAGSQPEVSITMNAEGGKIWERLTQESIGHAIAIVLDNYVRSYPNVNAKISGGRSSISGGGMTIEEAQDLANILKSGKMDAPAVILTEDIVGPSLGKEAINAGLLSFILAFVLVLLYMIFYYNKAGFTANLALIINVFFIMGVLASLGAVLTLPGIAGIILTIGMSVDANVLIFERIREELTAGKGLKLAIRDGYQNAYSAIIDANVTTLLTGIILYSVGTGPIKGFATTLVIGIFTSLFSAIFITRLIFESRLAKEKKITFNTGLTRNAWKNMGVKFLEKRKIFYIISGVLIGASLLSLAVRGLSLGVDFTGGRTYVVRFDEPVNSSDLVNSLATPFENEPDVKTFGSSRQVKVSTAYMIGSDLREADSIVEDALYRGCVDYLPPGTDKETFLEVNRMESHMVGPTIADDIIKSAFIAVILALIGIFLYILLRFRTWQFGLGAVAALFHDVIIVLGLYSILYSIMPFSLEIDQAFIAAILTVVGYSINDTVVVFDRVREYINLFRKRDRKLIVNQALNSTLSRTFSTSLSTLVVLLAIFIFGGASIRGFIFAMMIGVIVGTYSSLFIASPIVYDLVKKKEKVLEKGKK